MADIWKIWRTQPFPVLTHSLFINLCKTDYEYKSYYQYFSCCCFDYFSYDEHEILNISSVTKEAVRFLMWKKMKLSFQIKKVINKIYIPTNICILKYASNILSLSKEMVWYYKRSKNFLHEEWNTIYSKIKVIAANILFIITIFSVKPNFLSFSARNILWIFRSTFNGTRLI